MANYIDELLAMDDEVLETELENVKVRNFRAFLKLAVKEIQRDQRHACAEAVNALEAKNHGLEWGPCVKQSTAHQAVMNAKVNNA